MDTYCLPAAAERRTDRGIALPPRVTADAFGRDPQQERIQPECGVIVLFRRGMITLPVTLVAESRQNPEAKAPSLRIGSSVSDQRCL